MTIRSRGPAAGFGWLTRGLQISFRHPKPLMGGAALLAIACLLPSLVTLPVQLHAATAGTPPSSTLMGALMIGAALVGLLIVPLYAGYLRVIDAAARGLPARATDVFKPYRQGDAPLLIGYGLAVLLFYAAVFAAIFAATSRGLTGWYMQVLAAQASHQPPPTALPSGFGTALALAMVFGLFMMGFYAISLGQVSLRKRSVFGAIGDGLAGAFKNLLPLVVFALSALIAWLVAGITLLLVATLLAVIGALVGGWLALVLIVPLYVALILVLVAVMFSVMYCLWHDVCGDDVVPGVASTTA